MHRELRDMRGREQSSESTLAQTAANEYSSTLQQLDMYEQLKSPGPLSSVVSVGSDEEGVTATKRKVDSTSQFW
jgi:hypothetical protein